MHESNEITRATNFEFATFDVYDLSNHETWRATKTTQQKRSEPPSSAGTRPCYLGDSNLGTCRCVDH